eukprot:6182767-Pleurochrysis_carterae.AAC.1
MVGGTLTSVPLAYARAGNKRRRQRGRFPTCRGRRREGSTRRALASLLAASLAGADTWES